MPAEQASANWSLLKSPTENQLFQPGRFGGLGEYQHKNRCAASISFLEAVFAFKVY